MRRAPFRTGKGDEEREVWIYVLVEHRSRPDRLVPFGVLPATVQIWERTA